MKRIVLLGTLTTFLYSSPLSTNLKKAGGSIKSPDVIFTKKAKKAKNIKNIVNTAMKYLGVKYRFGGNTRKGIDCSGFTKIVMKKHGTKLPRTAREQAKVGKRVSRKNLKAGDLIFFKGTSSHARISHVGIMISKDKFIHASSGKKKVIISSINKAYYRAHYYSARRV